MEFAVIILALFILLLQIVILVNQQKNGKIIREFIEQRSKAFHSDRDKFRERKENSNRHNRQDFRSKQPNTPTPAATPGNGDNVEKSLRDINLKLKNAERDQEVARRRMQENIGKEHPRRRHHNDNNRGGRDGGRDHRRDRRDRHNRNNWQSRSNQERQHQGTEHPSEQPEMESPLATVPVNETVIEQNAPSLPDLNPTDFDTDNTQHGRKFMVKRRPLTETVPGENTEQSSSSTSDTDSASVPMAEPTAPSAPVEQSDQGSDAEISFGRR